jgi:hypothetical protein
MSRAELVGVGRNGNNTNRAMTTRGSLCSHFFISKKIITNTGVCEKGIDGTIGFDYLTYRSVSNVYDTKRNATRN